LSFQDFKLLRIKCLVGAAGVEPATCTIFLAAAHRTGSCICLSRSETGEGTHSFVLAGISQDKHYLLHFEDGSSADRDISGSELMQSGLKVNLQAPLSSELVFLTEIATNNR
jgi:Glycosyl hydrolase family 36 C-terminal domain